MNELSYERSTENENRKKKISTTMNQQPITEKKTEIKKKMKCVRSQYEFWFMCVCFSFQFVIPLEAMRSSLHQIGMLVFDC